MKTKRYKEAAAHAASSAASMTRYRWSWPWIHWGDAPCGLPAARFYRVLAEPAATPNRDKLLTSF